MTRDSRSAGRPSLPLLRLWEETLHQLLDDTERFPKRIRYSFVARLDQHALDVLEHLTNARYATGERERDELRAADRALARLKVVLRVAVERGHLSRTRYAGHAERLETAGRMLGGWIKESES